MLRRRRNKSKTVFSENESGSKGVNQNWLAWRLRKLLLYECRSDIFCRDAVRRLQNAFTNRQKQFENDLLYVKKLTRKLYTYMERNVGTVLKLLKKVQSVGEHCSPSFSSERAALQAIMESEEHKLEQKSPFQTIEVKMYAMRTLCNNLPQHGRLDWSWYDVCSAKQGQM